MPAALHAGANERPHAGHVDLPAHWEIDRPGLAVELGIEELPGVRKARTLHEADSNAPFQGDEDANNAVVLEHGRAERAARLPPLDELYDVRVARVDDLTQLGEDGPALARGRVDDGIDVSIRTGHCTRQPGQEP